MTTEIEIVPSGVASMMRAEIDVQISTAHAYPRNVAAVIDSAKSIATRTQEIAEACTYSKPIGKGEFAEGPSIRLAEIVFSTWRNLRGGARIVEVGERHITAQGVVHDLESNVVFTAEVQRSIMSSSKRGKPYRYSDNLIAVTCQAAQAIAFRNAVFKAIPGAVVAEVLEAAQQKSLGNARKGKARDVQAKGREVLDKLTDRFGVTERQALDAVQRDRVEDLEPSDIRRLIGLGTAISEGETTAREAFPSRSRPETNGQTKSDEPPGDDEIDLDSGETW